MNLTFVPIYISIQAHIFKVKYLSAGVHLFIEKKVIYYGLLITLYFLHSL